MKHSSHNWYLKEKLINILSLLLPLEHGPNLPGGLSQENKAGQDTEGGKERFSLTEYVQVENEFRKPRIGLHIPPAEGGEPVHRASEEDRTFGAKPCETPKQTELWTQQTHVGSWLLLDPGWGMGAA